MPKAKNPPLKLGEETWGERLRRGYYRSVREYGRKWEVLSQVISEVDSITDTTLMGLMKFESKPAKAEKLRQAWLLCLALGIDPAELDLYPEDLNSGFLTSKSVADLLKPPTPCFAISAA